MHGNTRRWLRVLAIAAAGLFVCGECLWDADAQALGRVRSRLRQVLGRRQQVERKLKNIKAEQATAKYRLSKVQKDLAEARARRDAAKRRLSEVRAVLRDIKADQKETEARLARHSEAMSERLLAMYQVGMPSYLEVVLNATDFADFANRAEVTRRFARQDQQLLSDLVATKRKLAEQRATLEVKERDCARLRTSIAQETALVEARTREAHSLVRKANRDRAAAEAEYQALLEAARDMQALIKSVQSGRGGARYTGKWSGHFLTPVQGRISSPFGWRNHPVWHTRRFHNGIDIAVAAGTPIKAADKGLVIHAGWWGAYGNCIIIDHGSGWSTMYGHCSSLLVSKGDVVTRGETIGRVGNTGVSTGPHLHWTVWKNGNAVNPLSL
jgi:murein DD-endopeptidase MepM/ murein hydrolase activator NlpD